MNIGYACLTIGAMNTNYRSCTLKNANKENLISLIDENLDALSNAIDYNIKNHINLFRITSDLIPFGSSPANSLHWWDMFSIKFDTIGNKIKKSNMRVSMHPGQYTVLNSPNEDIVDRAIMDLEYHTKVLDSLKVSRDNKIILHIGGVYNDKPAAMSRFIHNYERLSDNVKNRLVIENDDKSYTIEDVLTIGHKLSIPVIYDNLHNYLNPSDREKTDEYYINLVKPLWKIEDGTQKIHFSIQDSIKKGGSHSKTIDIKTFLQFCKGVKRDDIDIMLEVKDKNLSAIKCIQCLKNGLPYKELEREWNKYKYVILETSPSLHDELEYRINEQSISPRFFYQKIEEGITLLKSTDNIILAAKKLYSILSKDLTEKEKTNFTKYLDDVSKLKSSPLTLKNYLYRLSFKYKNVDLLNNYYFYI
jgi:UV DNA damage endonuclease